MPWGSYCNVIWIYRWRKKFLLGWGSGEIFICMITYWQTLGTARFFLTFPHPCLARNAAASLALQHLGTTGSPSCSWFLGVPTFLQQVTAVLKRELLSAWNLIYSSRGKKKNKKIWSWQQSQRKTDNRTASVLIFLTAPGICPLLALLNKLAIAALSLYFQPPARAICITKQAAQLRVQHWLYGHQESSVHADALPCWLLLRWVQCLR